MIDDILRYNDDFVKNKLFKKYATTKFPDKKIVVVSCMDTRLIELLPAALGFKNGDVKMIKNAGASISHPYGSVMRSILISIYELQVKDILIIGHTDCGASKITSESLIKKMIDRGIKQEKINEVSKKEFDILTWFDGFNDVGETIIESVNIIKNHPLIPENINVHALLIDSKTGKLKKIC